MSTAAVTTRTFLVAAVRGAVRGAVQNLLPPVQVTVVGGTLKTAKAEARTRTATTFRGEVRTVTLLSATRS